MTTTTRNPRRKPAPHGKADPSEAGTGQLPFNLWQGAESAPIAPWLKPSFLDAMMHINTQVMKFTQHRMAEYLALPGKLSDSQSWDDVNHHCISFFDEATSDYSNEMEKMSTMLIDATQHLVEADKTLEADR